MHFDNYVIFRLIRCVKTLVLIANYQFLKNHQSDLLAQACELSNMFTMTMLNNNRRSTGLHKTLILQKFYFLQIRPTSLQS